jgi:virginiamycin B lyase
MRLTASVTAHARLLAVALIGAVAWLGGFVTGASAQPTVAFQEFDVPATDRVPTDIVLAPDGNVWFTEELGNRIGRITTTAQPGSPVGTVTEFVIPTPNSGPTGITVGPDNRLWFTQRAANKIGRINVFAEPGNPVGTITEFFVPTANSAPTDIALGADGRLWFTQQNANKIGRITAVAQPGIPVGTITEFTIFSTPASGPRDIAPGPDGNLWFTQQAANRIGRINPVVQPGLPVVGTVVDFLIVTTPNSGPTGITAGPDGFMWFTEQTANKIGRIEVFGQAGSPIGTVTDFFIVTTPDSAPTGITQGPDGRLWFTERDGNKIGRINPIAEPGTPIGTVTDFPIPTLNSGPLGITQGPDGSLWFTEGIANQIGRVRVPVTLTVVLTGPGTGSVSSTPGGILCPPTCAATFLTGTPLTLNASPAAGFFFTGWLRAGCGDFGPCVITNPSGTVTAVFDVFSDVPASNFAREHIAAIREAGVTAGCGTAPLRYCPTDEVSREQMAVFLLRALEGASFLPPPCTTAPFGDVPCSSPFAPWIAELVARGITSGCGGGNYCPADPVTREQMSVFLLKTLGVTPPPCTTSPFTDVPCSSPFSAFIVELANRGITAGCAPGLFCPMDTVTRDQMAVFLTRAFGFPL